MPHFATKLRFWWVGQREAILRITGLFGSVASVGGLLLAVLPPISELNLPAIILLSFTGIAFVFLSSIELISLRRVHVYSGNDAEGIRGYMHGWIKDGGRVAIWTRDMTWAQNPETKTMLAKKAADDELIVCVPKQTALTTYLAQAGAEVCIYGEKYLADPASRFTITLFGKDGSRVAVGHAVGESHVIHEFDPRSHPAFYVAKDLINIVQAKHREPAAK